MGGLRVEAGMGPSAWEQGAHLVAALLWRTGFRLVCTGWDVHLWMKEAAADGAGWRVDTHWGHPTPASQPLTWRTTPMTGRFKVCPGTGAGHWSISLQTVNTGGPRQKPVLEEAARRSHQELQLG